MKKKIYTNPAIYPVFIVGVIAAIMMLIRLITKEDYINLAQEIATYVMTIALIFSVYWIGRAIIKPIPLTYNQNEITIIRYFGKNVLLKYKEILKVEYYNRYMRLIIKTNTKKYRFNFVVKTKELKDIIKKKVKDVNY